MSKTLVFSAVVATAALVAGAATYGPAASGAGQTTRVSVTGDEGEANGWSSGPVVSDDGGYVAFTSYASNLSMVDTNRRPDVYLRDRVSGTTELVSVGLSGSAAEGRVTDISADGRFVVFTSSGAGHVTDDNNAVDDVFVRDRNTGVTERISLENNGDQSHKASADGTISSDGRYVAFASDGRLAKQDQDSLGRDVYVRDRVNDTTKLVSVTRGGKQGGGMWPVISDNGRFITFTSGSGSLVRHDTNGKDDVFLRDLVKGSTSRVSVSSSGAQGKKPSYSSQLTATGRKIVFTSRASNLVAGDRNGAEDVFLHDRVSGTTKIVSVNSREKRAGGPSGQARISASGGHVLFTSAADFLGGGYPLALYFRDLAAGETHLVIVEPDDAGVITADGHEIVFSSSSPDVVPNDTNDATDVFFYAW